MVHIHSLSNFGAFLLWLTGCTQCAQGMSSTVLLLNGLIDVQWLEPECSVVES